ncbi:MAG: hypothetical protein LAT76_09995, partial [Schleiferiaceae bacterium]|nr:hypothetical protein [Schleiferiaceae bacterium]
VQSNVVYYWSLFSDGDRFLILVRDRAGEVMHSYDISAFNDRANIYTLGRDGLYIFNPKTATVSVYPIE